jgi:hypothetical protein
MSDAKCVISNLYLKKSESNANSEVKLPVEAKPFTIEPELAVAPVAVATSLACAKTGLSLRKNGITDLALYLESWYLTKGAAVQLDGKDYYKNNPAPWVYFEYQGGIYKLAGDTKDWAVKNFIDLARGNHAYSTVLVPDIGKKGNPVLRLAGSSNAKGWYCTSV